MPVKMFVSSGITKSIHPLNCYDSYPVKHNVLQTIPYHNQSESQPCRAPNIQIQILLFFLCVGCVICFWYSLDISVSKFNSCKSGMISNTIVRCAGFRFFTILRIAILSKTKRSEGEQGVLFDSLQALP